MATPTILHVFSRNHFFLHQWIFIDLCVWQHLFAIQPWYRKSSPLPLSLHLSLLPFLSSLYQSSLVYALLPRKPEDEARKKNSFKWKIFKVNFHIFSFVFVYGLWIEKTSSSMIECRETEKNDMIGDTISRCGLKRMKMNRSTQYIHSHTRVLVEETNYWIEQVLFHYIFH